MDDFKRNPDTELTFDAQKTPNRTERETPSAEKKPAAKLVEWERRLLDLSTRNTLLNLPKNHSVERILSSDIAKIEDTLSCGEEFRILPLPDWIAGLTEAGTDGNGKAAPWLQQAEAAQGYYELTDWRAGAADLGARIQEEYAGCRLYTFCSAKELDKSMTGIFRSARSAKQENGVSNLFLAMGLLRWYETLNAGDGKSGEAHYAPLLLIPVDIRRLGANQGYTIRRRDDDPYFNTTLLELLKQKYDIVIDGLEPLPMDQSGISVPRIFQIVREQIQAAEGWDVAETCVIGNFTFAQFAMWHDIHTAGEKLETSGIVRRLMKYKADETDIQPAEREPDGEPVLVPVSLDETQLSAVRAAAEGETFVLFGPPGTGKSQTITAMIANLIAKKKTVLFVAEKEAALNVVQHRLNELGLGAFCLELHSEKASKKHLLHQLENVLELAEQQDLDCDYAYCLENSRDSGAKLDEYAESLHRLQPCGYRLYELIGLYESVSSSEETVGFTPEEVRPMTKNGIRRHQGLLEALMAAGSALGDISTHPLKGLRLTENSSQFRAQLQERTAAFRTSIETLAAAGESLAAELGIPAPQRKSEYLDIAERLLPCLDELRADPVRLTLIESGTAEADAYLDEVERNEREELSLLRIWRPGFLRADPEAYLAKLESAGKKLLGRKAAVSGIYGEIRTLLLPGRDLTDEEIVPALERVSMFRRDRESQERGYQRLPQQIRDIVDRFGSKEKVAGGYAAAMSFAEGCAALFGSVEEARSLAERLCDSPLTESFREALEAYSGAEAALNSDIRRAPADGQTDLRDELKFCEQLSLHGGDLKDLALYNQSREECVKEGLLPAVKAYEDGMPGERLVRAYQKGLYKTLIEDAIDSDPVVGDFSGTRHSESVRQFHRKDTELIRQTKAEIFNRLKAGLPSPKEPSPVPEQLGDLRKAISIGGRGISIRELFGRISEILPRVAPCMLMSPDSVAQYLPQENGIFDVVIFDEASQMPTCKAVGALYRGKNAVIVGDDKQMPPTSFFQSNMLRTENVFDEDLPSVLEDVKALGVPRRELRWHYRSTHESLIAFSNAKFYENRIRTFPSADDMEQRVTTVFTGGIYHDGTNPIEAQRIVDEVVRRSADPEHREQTMGIVTFNIQQRRLIEDLLAKQYQEDRDFDVWAHSQDPDRSLFVKNLENVQGDERDVILFSVCFGPDERGRVVNNFGPVGQDGGEKRLNVAFTRARVEMVVFTSMHPEDIHAASPGAEALRDFLRYAEGRGMDSLSGEAAVQNAEGGTEGVMDAICAVIRDCGLEYRRMVGHSSIRVDIAVVDPFTPTRYMLGILLDGSSYRDSGNTRDREVSQSAVLQRLGWDLQRIWTIDWWEKREKETENLRARLEAARQKAQAAYEAAQAEKGTDRAEIPEEMQEAPTEQAEASAEAAEEIIREYPEEAAAEEVPAPAEDMAYADAGDMILLVSEESVDAAAVPEPPEAPAAAEEMAYADAGDMILLPSDESAEAPEGSRSMTAEDYRLEPYVYYSKVQPMSMAEFVQPENFARISAAAAEILETEAPIRKELLLTRLRKAFGVTKTAAVAEVTERALKEAAPGFTQDGEIWFCWRPETSTGEYRAARAEIGTQGRRGMEEIPRQELRNAICIVLCGTGSAEKETLLRDAAKLLGFTRYTAAVAAGMERGFQYAKYMGDIRWNESSRTYSMKRD